MNNLFLGILLITFSNYSLSQEITIDTNSWENEWSIIKQKGDVLIDIKHYQDSSMTEHFEQIDEVYYSGRTFYPNGATHWKWTSKRVEQEGLEAVAYYGTVKVGQETEFSETGDTLNFRLYPAEPELDFFEEYAELFAIEEVSYLYYDNGRLEKRESKSRIPSEKKAKSDPFNMAILGWQRKYYENGQLEYEELFEIPENKNQEYLTQFTENGLSYMSIRNRYSSGGSLLDSFVVLEKKIFGKGFYDNGQPFYEGESSISYYAENEEFEDIRKYDENGFSKVVNEKYVRKYKGEDLIYEEKIGKNLVSEYIKTFWESGNKKSIITKTRRQYFNNQGELLYSEEYDPESLRRNSNEEPSLFSSYYQDELIALDPFYSEDLKKCSTGEDYKKSQVHFLKIKGLDTAFFVNGKLLSIKEYENTADSSTYLSKSQNFASGETLKNTIWNNDTTISWSKDCGNGFFEEKRYEKSVLVKERKLLEQKDEKIIFEEKTFYSNGDLKTYEYRNYLDSIYYAVGPVYASYSKEEIVDSLILKKFFVPAYDEDWSFMGGSADPRKYPIEWYRLENNRILKKTETIWHEENKFVVGIFDSTYYDDNLIKSIVEYSDSTMTRRFTLEGYNYYKSLKKKNNRWDYTFSEKYYSIFDDKDARYDRIRQVLPYAPSQGGIYKDLVYTLDSSFVLVGNSYVIERASNNVLYQNPLNLKYVKSDWCHLFKYDNRLFLLSEKALYDFENDTEYLIPNLKRTLLVKDDEVFIFDGSDFVKKIEISGIVERHSLSAIDSIPFTPLSEWNQYYSFGTNKIVEVNQNFYDREIKTLDLDSEENVYVDLSALIKPAYFQKAGETFYYYESKEDQSIKAGKLIDTIFYFNINDSVIRVWPLKNVIKYQDGEISSSPEENGKVIKSTSVYPSITEVDGGLLISTTTFDQFDDFSEWTVDPENFRDFINIRINFVNRTVEYLKDAKDYSPFNMANSITETEQLIKNIRTTDQIQYSAIKKENLAKFQLEYGGEPIIFDLASGKMFTDKKHEYFDNNFWKRETKNESNVHLAASDKEFMMHFINGTYNLDTAALSNLFYSNDLATSDKKMFSNNTSNHLRLFWNGEEQNPRNRIVGISFLDQKPILYTPDRYYMSGYGAEKHLYFQKELRTYKFEQFDLKYNRPDIILERLGYADSALVGAYHSAYLKRLKKMGFTEKMLEDDFHLPEIEIENFEELPTLHDQGSIDIKLKIEDTKYKLDRINVWVNDVAVYGADGISLRDKDVQDYSTALKVDLAKGKNKVQVSVLNQAGAESYKETFEIECSAGKNDPDLYLITIGESEFQQSDFNLTYAAKDAKDIAALFDKSKAYGEVKTKTLVNQEVTKENVLGLKSFLAEADINDEVMIFIAGHGVLDANLDYFFATYDMDFQQPQNKGLAYEDLEGLLDGIKPLKKTLMIDACHSGEIDKDEVELAEVDAQEDGDVQFRAVGNTASPKLGMQNTSELTKSLFTDLRKGTGATVISSAGGMEFAMEGDDWSNGLFTYCFIKGIKSKAADYDKNGEIWLSEIKRYVSEQVTELSNGKQQPTSRIENQVVDFRVW